jgi:hypothetical protein
VWAGPCLHSQRGHSSFCFECSRATGGAVNEYKDECPLFLSLDGSLDFQARCGEVFELQLRFQRLQKVDRSLADFAKSCFADGIERLLPPCQPQVRRNPVAEERTYVLRELDKARLLLILRRSVCLGGQAFSDATTVFGSPEWIYFAG